MAVEIVAHGGGEALYYILNAVATITGGGDFVSLIKITLGFGLFWISFRTAFNFPFGDSLKWFMGYLVLYNAMLLPKETVLITDTFDSTFSRTVDNVPFGIAKIGSYTSQIGTGIAELFDKNLSLPDDMQYAKNGFLFGTKLIKDASRLKINDSEFSGNMDQFITQCVLYDIALGKYTSDELKSADDLWVFLTMQNTQSQLRMFTYATGGNKTYVTCSEGVALLAAKWDREINSQMTYLYKRNFDATTSDAAAANYISTYIQASDNYLMNNSKSITDIMRQNMMINAINNTADSYGSDSISEYSNLVSNSETKNNFERLAVQAEEWVPLLRTVFEAILYGIFPFVFLIFLLPSGHKAFMGYIGAFVWIQSWPPLYAILHLLMTLRNKSQLAFAGGAHTLDNFSVLNDINNNVSILAGATMMSIPYISLKLIPFAQAGLAGIGQMAGSMLAPATTAAASTAHEASRGNFSMGNSSMNNDSFDNSSAHKHDTSFSNQSYGGNLQNADGSITKYTGQGADHIDTTQMQSNFSHDMKTSMSMSDALQQRAGTSASMGHNLDQESSKQFTSAVDTASKMAHAFHQGKDSGEGWTKSIDTDTQKALENIDTINTRIHGGLSGGGFGLKGGVELSKDDQEVLKNSIAVINKASQSGHFNIQDSEGKSLNEELNTSFTKSQQLSEKASSYFNESKNLSNEATKTQSLEGTVTNNEATGFWNYLTRDKGMSRQEAVSVIENPDRSQTFQTLSNEYMTKKVDSLYSEKYGQSLMNDIKVDSNSYAAQSANFTIQHSNDVVNNNHLSKEAYNNTKIADVTGVDNSKLKDDVQSDLNQNQQGITEAPKHQLVDKIEDKIESVKDSVLEQFEKNRKGDS